MPISKIVITRFPLESAWGGEEEIHVLMAQVLQKHNIAVELLSSCPFLKNKFQEEGFCVHTEFQKDITSKLKILISPLTLPFFFMRGIFWLLYFRYVRKADAVLFLTLIEKIAWTPLAKMLGLKIFWAHHAPLGSWFYRHPYLFLWKLWSPYVRIAVPAQHMKQQLSSYTRANNILVLSNTISPNKDFSNLQNKYTAEDFFKFLQYKSGYQGDAKNTFFVGSANRLSPEKGMHDYITAITLLQNTPQNLHFCIAGKGPLEKELKNIVQKKKLVSAVSFLGFLTAPELGIFLSQIQLFVLPSHQEPFGIGLLEAMSAQKAIVATHTGGIPEVLGASNMGLCEKQNPPALAKKIAEIADNPKLQKQLAGENFHRFQEIFSPEIFEQNLLKVFLAKSN